MDDVVNSLHSPSRPRQIVIYPVFWECWRLMTVWWIILLEVPSAEESSAIQGHPFLPRGCYRCCHLADKSCLTLCDPTDCSVPGSSVHGISQTKILECVAISFFRGSSQSRDQTHVSCIGRQILYHWTSGEAPPSLHPTTGQCQVPKDQCLCLNPRQCKGSSLLQGFLWDQPKGSSQLITAQLLSLLSYHSFALPQDIDDKDTPL